MSKIDKLKKENALLRVALRLATEKNIYIDYVEIAGRKYATQRAMEAFNFYLLRSYEIIVGKKINKINNKMYSEDIIRTIINKLDLDKVEYFSNPIFEKHVDVSLDEKSVYFRKNGFTKIDPNSIKIIRRNDPSIE